MQYCTNNDKNTYITWRDWTTIGGDSGPNAMSLPSQWIFSGAGSHAYAIRFVVRVYSISSSSTSIPKVGNIKLIGTQA